MHKLKVGDTIQVMSGSEASAKIPSKRGKIIRIDREKERLVVEGLRIVKRHVRRGRDRNNMEGGRLERPGSIAIASVALVCKKCDQPTRVGIRAVEDGRKRFCKKCDALID